MSNPYIAHFGATVGNRDIIYQYALNLLGKKPATILEVGCARNLDMATRFSDGWSSIFFAQYVQAFGGEHIVVDVSADSLANCRTILQGTDSRTTFIQSTGAEVLRTTRPSLVLLDGSDDPAEMVTELSLIDPRVPVLCDDFHTKGVEVARARADYVLFGWQKHSHRMALFNAGVPPHAIVCPALD